MFRSAMHRATTETWLDGTRKRTDRFSAFLSHYLVKDRYGRPGEGRVEGMVGYLGIFNTQRFGDTFPQLYGQQRKLFSDVHNRCSKLGQSKKLRFPL